MRIRASVAASVVVLGALLIFAAAAARQISRELVRHERDNLLQTVPLVKDLIALHGADLSRELNAIKRFSGIDVTVSDIGNVIENTSLGGGKLAGSKFRIDRSKDAVFQVLDIQGVSSFVMAAPVQIDGVDKTLILSKPDETVGPFFDGFLTIGVAVLLLGILASLGLGWFLSHHEEVLKREISAAFSALAAKQFNFRLKEGVGGASFSAARIDFNRSMEELSKLNASTDQFIRSRLVEGQAERRALAAALGSVGQAIFIIDHLGKIIFFNSRMEALSGILGDEALGHTMSDLVTLQNAREEALGGLIPQVISTGVPQVFPEQTKLKRRDGIFVPVTVKTMPVKNDLRGAITHVVVLVDETDRKPVEKPELAPIKEAGTAPPPAKPAPSPVKELTFPPPRVSPLPAAPLSQPAAEKPVAVPPLPARAAPDGALSSPPPAPAPMPSSQPKPEPKKLEPLIIQPGSFSGFSAPVPQEKPEDPSLTPLEKIMNENEKGSLRLIAKEEGEREPPAAPPANLPI